MTIGISRNELPIATNSYQYFCIAATWRIQDEYNIHSSIANTNTNTYLENVLQYSGNTENSIGNTANTTTILQY